MNLKTFIAKLLVLLNNSTLSILYKILNLKSKNHKCIIPEEL